MSKKTSPVMEEAVQRAQAAGGVLTRYSGGFWAPPDSELRRGVPQPWYASTPTITALIDRGAVKVTERLNRGDPKTVRLIAS